MKRIYAFLLAMAASIALASAGDVTIKVAMSTDPEDKPTTTFAADTPMIYALFETKGLRNGDKLRGVWIAEDVGAVAPKETKIDDRTLDAEGDTDEGEFTLSKPTDGWPIGKYRVEIYVGDELAKTAKFTIHATAKSDG